MTRGDWGRGGGEGGGGFWDSFYQDVIEDPGWRGGGGVS